jgi:hypothetical protein
MRKTIIAVAVLGAASALSFERQETNVCEERQ